MADYEAQTREAWQRANTFPTNKEDVYPEHTVVQEFDSFKDKFILEYGCGGGSDAISFLKRGNRVVATDIVAANVAVTKRNIALHNLSRFATVLHLEHSYPLPFESEMFDVVSSHGVIHHIVDGPEVIKEFARVLRHSGLCYIMLYTEYMYEHFKDTIDQLVAQRGITKEEAFCWCSDGEGTPYAIPYTEESGTTMLEAAGLKVLQAPLWLNEQFRTFKAIKL